PEKLQIAVHLAKPVCVWLFPGSSPDPPDSQFESILPPKGVGYFRWAGRQSASLLLLLRQEVLQQTHRPLSIFLNKPHWRRLPTLGNREKPEPRPVRNLGR